MVFKSAVAPLANDKQVTQKLSDLAYAKVLEALFSGEIKPGSFVSQAALVEMLNTPIQPLRDALRVLETEGVLSVHPRSGIEFLKPDLEFARSTYQFRAIIERSAARHCATAGDVAYFEQLTLEHQDIIERIESGDFGNEVLELVEELEKKLHDGMLNTLNNPLVLVTARRLKNYVRLIRLERLATPPLILQSMREHIVILNAITARDESGAEAALAAHFQGSLQRVLGAF